MKNKELKKQLKNLQKSQVSESSLSLIKDNLKEYMNFYSPEKKPATENQAMTINDFKFPTLKVATVMVIIALILGSGRAAYASRDSLPGDALYSIKLITEDLGRIMIFDQEKKAEYEIKLAEKRIAEINTILNKEKYEEKNIKTAERLLEKHIQKANKLSENKALDFKEKIEEEVDKINKQKNNNGNKSRDSVSTPTENKNEKKEEATKNDKKMEDSTKNKSSSIEQENTELESKSNMTNEKSNDNHQQNNKKNGRKEV